VAESIKRVFDKHGNRKDKNKARLRFLLQSLGFVKFRDVCATELEALRASAPEALRLRPFPQPIGKADRRGPQPPSADLAAYQNWRESNVQPQKQAGLFRVDVPLPLGDIDSATMYALADVVAEYGDGLLWATQAQNLALRALSESELPSVHNELSRIGLASAQPSLLRNLVACAGASMCRLGICQSRGLAKSVSAGLLNSDLDLEKAGNVRIHISGCPNSCGRHLVADIGLHGTARRTATGLVPHYVVSLGGKTQEGQTRFGSECGTIPAKNVPNFIVDLLSHWTLVGDDRTLREYLGQSGHAAAKDLARVHGEPPTLDGDKNYHSDWDSEEPFSLAGRGAGECGAGVFDLIEVDLASASESLKVGEFYAATIAAARSLLVTRGEQPKTDIESLLLFQKHFIAGGLVDPAFDELIETALLNAAAPKPEGKFAPRPSDVTELVSTVRSLYDSMDVSLRFEPVRSQSKQPLLQPNQ
jgi:sulfite reductase (ferredoxin)